jgi:DUF1009 family protein
MLALIAGTGDLPPALIARLPERPFVCALQGFEPAIPVDLSFRLEHLGTFLATLAQRGVTQICMAGAVRRPVIDPAAIDAATMPLIPQVQAAMAQGDDGALRVIMALIEDAGFSILAAHEVASDLLPPAGVLTTVQPEDWHRADAAEGEACVAAMGRADVGQACVVRVGAVQGTEDDDGTDAMLMRFCAPYEVRDMPGDPISYLVDLGSGLIEQALDWITDDAGVPVTADDGILFKAPKPNQDRRADLPLIGPKTAMLAAEAELSGIVIEEGGVMVLDLEAVCQILNAQGMFLWVRPRGVT